VDVDSKESEKAGAPTLTEERAPLTLARRLYTTIAQNYYWRWFKQVASQIISFGKDQIVGLILAALILLYQLREGLVKPTELHANELATLAYPYLTLLALYVGYEALRAPFVIDRQRREEIGRLEGELRNRPERVSEVRAEPPAQPNVQACTRCAYRTDERSDIELEHR